MRRSVRALVPVLPASDGHGSARSVHRAGPRAKQRIEHGGFADVRIADEYDAPHRRRATGITGVASQVP